MQMGFTLMTKSPKRAKRKQSFPLLRLFSYVYPSSREPNFQDVDFLVCGMYYLITWLKAIANVIAAFVSGDYVPGFVTYGVHRIKYAVYLHSGT